MGMFDYTYHKCPECKRIAEGQSKASECSLKRYYFGDIKDELPEVVNEFTYESEEFYPANFEILAEAERFGLKCDHCGYKANVKLLSIVVDIS